MSRIFPMKSISNAFVEESIADLQSWLEYLEKRDNEKLGESSDLLDLDTADFLIAYADTAPFDAWLMKQEVVLAFWDSLRQNQIDEGVLQKLCNHIPSVVKCIRLHRPTPSVADRINWRDQAEGNCTRNWCFLIGSYCAVFIVALSKLRRFEKCILIAETLTITFLEKAFLEVSAVGKSEEFHSEVINSRIEWRFSVMQPIVLAMCVAFAPSDDEQVTPIDAELLEQVDDWLERLSSLSPIFPCLKLAAARTAAVIGTTRVTIIEAGLNRAREIQNQSTIQLFSDFRSAMGESVSGSFADSSAN